MEPGGLLADRADLLLQAERPSGWPMPGVGAVRGGAAARAAAAAGAAAAAFAGGGRRRRARRRRARAPARRRPEPARRRRRRQSGRGRQAEGGGDGGELENDLHLDPLDPPRGGWIRPPPGALRAGLIGRAITVPQACCAPDVALPERLMPRLPASLSVGRPSAGMGKKMTDEEVLAEFRAAGALLEGHFILSSGLHSPRYLQCARVLMDPDARLAPRRRARRHASRASCAAGSTSSSRRPWAASSSAMKWAARSASRPCSSSGRRARSSCAAASGSSPARRCCWSRTSSPPASPRARRSRRSTAEGGEVIAAAALVDRSGGEADLGVPFFPLVRLDVPDLRGGGPARRARRHPRRKAREPQGGVTPSNWRAPASGGQYRPCRDDPERARRRASRSGPRRLRRGRGGRRRHHRPSARGPAPHHRRRYRRADGAASKSR